MRTMAESSLSEEEANRRAQREKLLVMLLSNGYLLPQINQILEAELSIGKVIGH